MKVRHAKYEWMPLWFWCPDCGTSVQFEESDLGTRLRKRPKFIEGVWHISIQCPGCGTVKPMRTKSGE